MLCLLVCDCEKFGQKKIISLFLETFSSVGENNDIRNYEALFKAFMTLTFIVP